MLAWRCHYQGRITSRVPRRLLCVERRQGQSLLTLAIETSCDDTSVAILEKHGDTSANECNTSKLFSATLHFHEKITADNSQFRGVHPLISLDSHQTNLASLIKKALQSLPDASKDDSVASGPVAVRTNGLPVMKRKPDFVTVTRGPGMRSSLSTGIDTAKGLSVAWQVPLVGVNHMQAHALTPRLVSALEHDVSKPMQPSFPFLSLLVSGGHTLLVHSKALTDHGILATTSDIAIGDAIDKIARCVLPAKVLQNSGEIMYGRLLEEFVFPDPPVDYDYQAPARRAEELERKQTRWGWGLRVPLAETRSGSKSKSMEFSFSGLDSSCRRIVEKGNREIGVEERRDLGREAMRVAFEHLASRVVMALQHMQAGMHQNREISTLVLSGGVASNGFLRNILRAFLDIRGYAHIQIVFPPPSLCTDNAAMIAWTGIEMFEAGWDSELGCKALRKWSVDPQADDGGILGATDWRRHGSGDV